MIKKMKLDRKRIHEKKSKQSCNVSLVTWIKRASNFHINQLLKIDFKPLFVIQILVVIFLFVLILWI